MTAVISHSAGSTVTGQGPIPYFLTSNPLPFFFLPSRYTFSALLFLLFFLPLFPLSLPSSTFFSIPTSVDPAQPYLVLNSAFEGPYKKKNARPTRISLLLLLPLTHWQFYVLLVPSANQRARIHTDKYAPRNARESHCSTIVR